LFGSRLACAQAVIFSRQTVFHKCAKDINCPLGCGLRVKNFNIPQSEQKKSWTLVDFFIKYQCASQLGRQDSMQTAEQAGGWIHFCMEQLRTLNSYKIFEIKNKK
jgi:hypothetical protein